MNISTFLRSAHMVAICCIALAFLSFFVLSPDGSASIAVFILVALVTLIIRPIYDIHVKSLGYMFLGMLAYWSFGRLFVSSPPAPEIQIPVLLGFSAIGAILALITYSDGRPFGSAFAGGSMLLVFLAQRDIWTISAAVFVFLSAMAIVRFISKISSPGEFVKKAAIASVLSGLLLIAAMLSKTLGGAALGVYPVPGAVELALGAATAVAASLAFIFPTLKAFDFVLARIKFKRFIEGGQVLFGSIEAQPGERLQKQQKKRKGNQSI